MIIPNRSTSTRRLFLSTLKICGVLVIGANALCWDSFVAVKAKSPALSLPAAGSITANPSPIQICDGSGLGVTTLSWTSTGTSVVEVHLDDPTGMLLATTGPSGTVTTGKWVGNATQFFLQDVSGGLPLSPENTLATVTVYLTGCSSPGDKWSTSGNNINNTNTGNVGIGTAAPGFKLDVQGGQINSAGGLCIAGDCKNAWSQVGGAGSQWANDGSNISFTTGNVGVGTSSPGARLDIGGGNLRLQSGTLDFNNQIRDDAINLWGGDYTLGTRPWTVVARTAQRFRFESALSNSTLSAYELGSTAGATFFAVKNDGNVGIGTPLPAATLHISSSNNPNLLVDAYSTGSNLRFRRAGGTPSAPTAVLNGEVLGNLNFTGYGTTGFATGGRVIWQALAAENWTDTAQGAHAVISTTSTGSAVASERMRITSAGNVGIGTTSPGYTLDVTGQIRSSTGGFVFPDGTVQITAATGGGGGAVDSVFGRTGAVVQQAGDYTWAQITKTTSSLGDLQTRSAGDLNAGTVPIARLGVSGIPDATTFLRGDNTWAPVPGGPSQWATTPGTNNISYNAGNVGIGTTTPTTNFKLDVAGAQVISYSGDTVSSLLINATGNDGQPAFKVMMPATGQQKAFQLVNTGNSSGWASFEYNVGATGKPGLALGSGSVTRDTKLYRDSASVLRTDSTMIVDGNLGIGTTTPGYKLDVAGQIRSSTGGFMFPDGSVQTTAAGGAQSIFKNIANSSGTTQFSAGSINDSLRFEGTGGTSVSFDANNKKVIINSAGGGGGGTITEVIPGTGLAGGGTTGAVTLSVNYGSTVGTAVQGNKSITINTPDGIAGGTTLTLGTGGSLNLTNTDKGSSQFIFKTIANSAGTPQFSAGVNNDSLRFEGTGGTSVSFDASSRKVIINSTGSGTGGPSQWTTADSNIFYNTGNVGIGTTTPQGRLDVNGNALIGASVKMNIGLSATEYPSIGYNVGYTGDLNAYNYRAADSAALIRFGNGGRMSFHVAPSGAAGTPIAFNEAMVLTNSGNLGIGTTSPAFLLDVSGSANNPFRVRDSSGREYFSTTTREGPHGTAPIVNMAGRLTVDSTGPDGGNDTLVRRPVNNLIFAASEHPEPTLAGAFMVRQKDGSSILHVDQRTNGNVGIGTTTPTAKLDVNGNTNINGNINVTGTGNITAAGTIEGGNIKAKYQDVAEWVESSQELSAGTLVVLDHTKSNQVIASSQAYDTRVAGVISERPGIALGEAGDNKVLVATTGRVMLTVDASKGPIQIGDLLVTSDIPGVAMKSEAINVGGVQIHRPGTLIGKALEPLAKGQGKILVLLSLQ